MSEVPLYHTNPPLKSHQDYNTNRRSPLEPLTLQSNPTRITTLVGARPWSLSPPRRARPGPGPATNPVLTDRAASGSALVNHHPWTPSPPLRGRSRVGLDSALRRSNPRRDRCPGINLRNRSTACRRCRRPGLDGLTVRGVHLGRSTCHATRGH